MEIVWEIASEEEWRVDAVLFFVFEKDEETPAGLKSFLSGPGAWLANIPALSDFKGKRNEVAVFYAPAGDAAVPRVVLSGLGTADKFEKDMLRSAAAFALRKCRDMGIARAGISVPALGGLPSGPPDCLREIVTGAVTGLHRYTEFKTKNSEPPQAPEVLLLLSGTEPEEVLRQAVARAQDEAAGMILARDLTIAPANRVTPTFLAEKASELAAKFGFKIEKIDAEAARDLGMGAFAAVAAGSAEPACMIIIEHVPPGTENDAPIVFIGKGITFDTGGISLKPSAKLEEMKHDMAGAAAVLGALDATGRAGLAKRVIGILPCTENMPGGRAYKPGDVLRSYSGQTIEVISTDAEGRLLLCDALAYAAEKFKPALIVDIATLTGACIVALGKEIAGVFGNREDLPRFIRETGAGVGEQFWQLPLWDSYFEALKSDVADMKNVGDRSGGAIVAGVFLKQFVPDEVPWAHLDIAGTAWAEKDTGALPRGATGFGVRTLFEIARTWPDAKLRSS